MKIGILTLPLHTNYGGILQAYALQTVLERMGHEVSLIHGTGVIKKSLYRRIRHKLSPLRRFVIQNLIPDQFAKDSGRYTRRFTQKWIKRYDFKSTDLIPSDFYDAIVVGSDQIWRQIYVEKSNFLNRIETAYLDFARSWHIKRISYAASFGTDVWEYDSESTDKCAELIQLFDAVSVREESGISLCNKYLSCEAVHVLDPTLLLNKEDYIRLITKRNKKNKGIMTYILDEDEKKKEIIQDCCKKIGKPSFAANIPYTKLDKHCRGIMQPPLENWL